VENITSLFGGQSNLTWGQRAAYVVGGLGLAAAGVQPRPNPLLNVIALVGGSYLAYSGYKGHCPAKAALFDSSQGNIGSISGRSSGSDRRLAGSRAWERGPAV
jgi:threonine/homoserine/homoserine lactone efflux protein